MPEEFITNYQSDQPMVGGDIAPQNPWENFDPLKNRYPAFANQIDTFRKEGIPDHVSKAWFRERFEPWFNFVGNAENVNKFFGRSPETLARDREYANYSEFQNLKYFFPNNSDQEISDAIFMSTYQRGGVSPETLLSNPPLMEKIKGDLKISEGYWESAKRGANNWYINQRIGFLWVRAMVNEISDEEALKQDAELQKQLLPEPLNASFGNDLIAGTSQVLAQGYGNAGMGTVVGAVLGGVGALAAGLVGGPAAAVEAGKTGYFFGQLATNAVSLFSMQAGLDFREFIQLKDENGQTIDRDLARGAATFTGVVTVLTEFALLDKIAGLYPGMRTLLGMNKPGLINLASSNPVVKDMFIQLGKKTLTGINASTLHNLVESVVPNLTKEVLTKDVSNIDWKKILIEGGDTLVRSYRDFTGAAMFGIAIKDLPAIALNTSRFLKNAKIVAQQTGTTPKQVQNAFAQAINIERGEGDTTQQEQEAQQAPVETQPEIQTQETNPVPVETPQAPVEIQAEQAPISEQENTPVNTAEINDMNDRLTSWLSENNIEKAKGKTKEEIIKEFGNELQPIAFIPEGYLKFFNSSITDNRVYSGMGYFLDHAVNHHPEVDPVKYLDIQKIIDTADDVRFDQRNSSILFIKNIGEQGAEIVSIAEKNNGKIVLHKTFMNKLKVKYFEKMTDIKLSPEVGQTSISPETEASAAGGLSALDDKNKISLPGNLVNSQNQEQVQEKTAPEESAQIQQEQAQPVQQTTEAPQEATQQAPQPDFVYVPKAKIERFNAENPESAIEVEAAVNTDDEAGFTPEQFEQIKAEHPDFVLEINNDIRYGSNTKTLNETVKKAEQTDPVKAEIYQSPEIQEEIQKVSESFVNAGETQENANILGQIAGVLHTGLLARFGQGLSGITVRNIGEIAKDFSKALKITNNDFDLTIKNPVENIENLRIYTFHEDANNTNSQGFKEGDLIVNIDGEDVGTLDKGNILRFKKGYKFNFNYETREALQEKINNEMDTSEENTGESYNKVMPEDLKAVQAIPGKSINDFTDEEIAATKIWEKKYEQELGTKSPYYRAKYGDWRAKDKTPVNIVNVTKTADEMQRGTFKNDDTGWDILVSRQILGETKTHSRRKKQIFIDALGNIDEIIKNAVLLDTKTRQTPKSDVQAVNKNNMAFMHSLYSVIKDSDENFYLVNLMVQELYNNKEENTFKRAYELRGISQTPLQANRLTLNEKGYTYATLNGVNINTISDLFQAVKDNDPNFQPKEYSPQNVNGYAYTDPNGVVVAETQWYWGRAFIDLVKSGNFAANVHEIGHVTLNTMVKLMESGANEIANDVKIIFDHAGITLEQWRAENSKTKGGAREKAHEYFAKAFEAYMAEGKAPTTALQKLFQRVSKFLREIYDDITTQLGIQLDDQVRGVFDRLFTLPGDKNTKITEIVQRSNATENQVQAYKDQARQIAAENNLNLPTVQKLAEATQGLEVNENGEITQELDPQALEQAQEWQGQLDLDSIHEKEFNAEREGIRHVVDAIKQYGGIDYHSIIPYANSREHAQEIYRNNQALFRGAGTKLSIDEMANYLVMDENHRLAEFASQGEAYSGGGGGDVDLLMQWLGSHTTNRFNNPNSGVYQHQLTPLQAVNDNFVYALMTLDNGLEGVRDYLERRLERLDNLDENANLTEENRQAHEAERQIITQWQERLAPAVEESKNKKQSKKKKITQRDVNKAVNTAYKIGVQEERAKQNLKQQVKKIQLSENAQKKLAELQAKREADKAYAKERLKKQLERLNERHEKRLTRQQEVALNQINRLNKRIENLKNSAFMQKTKKAMTEMVKDIFKMSKSSQVYQTELDEIQRLLENFELKPQRGQDALRRNAVLNFFNNEGEQYTADYLEEIGLTKEEAQAFFNEYLSKAHIEDMTLQELTKLHEQVKEIYKRGKEHKQRWKAARDARIAENQRAFAQDIIAKTKEPEKTIPTNKQDLVLKDGRKLFRWFYNSTKDARRFMDGIGKNFTRLIMDRVTDARNEADRNIYRGETKMRKLALEKGGIIPERDMHKIATTLDGKTWTWKEILAVYVYSKNPKSEAAVIWGNFIGNDRLYSTEAEARSAIGKLMQFLAENETGQKMTQFADALVQYFKENYPRIRNAQIEATSQGMGKEDFYFPMYRMQRATGQGVLDIVTDNILNGIDSSNQLIPKVENGFTISRAEISNQAQQPIILDLWGNFERALREQEYHAALRGPVSEITSALIRNGENNTSSIQELIKKRMGNDVWTDLVSIIKDTVKDNAIAEQDAGNALINWIKKNRTVSFLAYNIPGMLAQTPSYISGVAYALNHLGLNGAGHMFRSLYNSLTNHHEFMEKVYEKNPSLRNSGGDIYVRSYLEEARYSDYAQSHPRTGKARNAYNKFMAWGLKGFSFFDRATKAIVFDGAYNSYLENGASEQEAIRQARAAVQYTQPPSFAYEMTRLNRSPVMGFFTQFTNALVPYYNMTVVDTINALSSNKWNAVKQIGLYVTATALSMILTQFFRDLFNNRLPTGDIKPNGEEDTWSQWTSNAVIDNIFNAFPLGSYWYKTLTSGRMSAGSYRNNDNPFTYPISRFKSSWYYFNNDSWRGPKPIKGGINLLEGLSTLGAVPAPTSGIKMFYNLLDLEPDY